jgi:hypothetical protein
MRYDDAAPARFPSIKSRYGIPADRLRQLYERDQGICVYCHKPMAFHDPNIPRGKWYTIEHLGMVKVPRSRCSTDSLL